MPDVAVIGGGAVGLTVAALFAKSGVSTAVVETKKLPPRKPKPKPELRTLALNRASEAILRACGAWEQMDADRIQPWTRMQVWEQTGSDGIEFLASDINESRLGCIVENTVLLRGLHRALAKSDVEFYCPDSLIRIEPGAGGVGLDLESGARLEVSAVVAADGADSKTRALAELDWAYHAHPEHAIVAEVKTEAPGEPTAWQRFTPEGPIALLPLFNQHYSLVWSNSGAPDLMSLEADSFGAALTEALEGRLGAIRLCGKRQQFPLGRGFARHWCADRVVLVGDAAHVVHPLAGLGQNLGLMDAAVLQEEWDAHPNSARALRAYERRRKGPVRATQCVLEGFRLGFGSEWGGIRQASSIAMGLAGRNRALRRFFIEQADGCMDGPQWLRGGRARAA